LSFNSIFHSFKDDGIWSYLFHKMVFMPTRKAFQITPRFLEWVLVSTFLFSFSVTLGG